MHTRAKDCMGVPSSLTADARRFWIRLTACIEPHGLLNPPTNPGPLPVIPVNGAILVLRK